MYTKNKYKYVIAATLLLWIMACTKIDNNYKDLIKPGGRVYAEKAQAIARAGYKKVDIVWPKAADPNIASAKIFWNNYADSMAVTIDPNQDTVKVSITGLAEQYYTFTVKTYDKDGNSSVPVEVTGRAYGDTYIAGLTNRFLQSVIEKTGILTINWGAAAVYNGEVGVQLVYNDKNGIQKTYTVTNNETSSIISDYLPTTQFTYRTVFLADSNAVDTVYTAYKAIEDITFDKTLWKVIAFSSQHTADADNRVTNIIDGTAATRWHTKVDAVTKYPHFVTVDMQIEKTITKFSVTRTTAFSTSGDDRGPDTFQLLVSNDNVQWTDLGTFNFVRQSNDEQFYPIASHPKARYFKFIALTGPLDFMVLGEISAFGF